MSCPSSIDLLSHESYAWPLSYRPINQMSTRTPTTKTLERRVVSLYLAGEGKQSVCKQTGVSAWVFYRILEDHGIARRKRGTRSASCRYRWTDKQLLEMCEARERLPVARVQKLYDIDDTTLWRHCKRLGYGSKRLKLPWDRDFFSRQTPEVAYWAGFILADGNVFVRSPKSTQLTLSASRIDSNHIAAFRKAIKSSHRIQERAGADVSVRGRKGRSRPQVVITVSGDGSLAAALRQWGVVPNKTRHWVEPKIQSRLLRHYLRGWFDGDGTLAFKGDRNQYFKVTGNRKALEWYLKQLQALGHPASAYFSKSLPGSSACDMRINGRWQVLRVAALLFRDGDRCLLRKWAIADHPDWKLRRRIPAPR